MRGRLRGFVKSKLEQLGLQVFFEKAEAGEFEHGAAEANPPETEAEIIQMPFWPEPVRAAPSDLLRSALFGIRKKGSREFLSGDEALASWSGCELRFHGQRLDQFDEDVWLQALHLHRRQDLPSIVFSTNRAFLKELGLSGGGPNIERLHQSLTRLQGAVIKLDTPEYLFNRNLIAGWDLEKGTERIAIELEPEVAQLFAGNVSMLDWQTRLSLRTDLAKWLHGYVQTHKATKKHPHRVAVGVLRELCGATTPLKNYRYKLKAACEQLKASRALHSWRITPNDCLEFVRPERTLKALSA